MYESCLYKVYVQKWTKKKGKAYEAEKQDHSDGNWLIVKCDDGIQRLFTKDVFQSISEWREKKLNDLGIK